jgi:hypothetical protein
MNATWTYQRIGEAIMIKWSPGESGAAPKDRRLLLIAWPVGSPGPDMMIGHWHEAREGIRVNAVAPGPIWTPLIPSTMPEYAVAEFGKNVPMKRPGQPAELATAYVMLADPMSSYVSGATIAVTGGKPLL